MVMSVTHRLCFPAACGPASTRQFGSGSRAAVRRMHRGESGQTSSEYVALAGLLAGVILLLFAGVFRDAMTDATNSIAETLHGAVAGMRVD